jgi:hypothetical protein
MDGTHAKPPDKPVIDEEKATPYSKRKGKLFGQLATNSVPIADSNYRDVSDSPTEPLRLAYPLLVVLPDYDFSLGLTLQSGAYDV